ncbi:MAG: DNA recombination protein RmuC [Thermodesulfovibrionales bacterium]|nr:DNA recombination protein RmuC [Thermodesulfovibrionales bacterium]
MTTIIIAGIAGLMLGGIIAWLIASPRLQGRAKSAEAVNSELRQQILQKDAELSKIRTDITEEKQARASMDAKYQEAEKNLKTMEEWVLGKLDSISLNALTKNSEEFLKLAEAKLNSQTIEGKKELEGKKDLIDKSVETIAKTISDMQKKLEDVEKGSVKISTLVEHHADITSKLKDTTEHLKHALASSKKRGEWGERMAEDILRLVGLVEGINYIKQKTLEGSSGRPDYTFFLPNRMKINMDVKFPLDNYQNYLDAQTDHDKKKFREELLRNTKIMIKQVTNRAYIDTADNTVDYVIVFIPNEQVYSFINETDPSIMDEALKQKVILCSPFTLYAVLAVIRQAVANFNLERTASEILKLLGEFSKQWGLYKEKFEVMGKRLDDAKKEYDIIATTRSNMLEKPLKKIDDLKRQKAIDFDVDIDADFDKPALPE